MLIKKDFLDKSSSLIIDFGIFNITISKEKLPDIDDVGIKRYFKGKMLHREGDKPARIYDDGNSQWCFYKKELLIKNWSVL
jgi:hypothetical protein